MLNVNVDNVYEKLKAGRHSSYDEEKHCKLILRIMLNQGRVSAFCTEVQIHEKTFYTWISKHELFGECYRLGQMYARENWELEGEEIAKYENEPGVISHRFEHWRLKGWSRYGIGSTNRVKLKIAAEDSPDKHYAQLLKQASEGDFTAAEIKQLMEAINVGLRTHELIKLQERIDELESNILTMAKNNNGNSPVKA